ncbi:hypothetical protein SAMN04488004_107130 [Loktanella salsilacus]|uniref:Transferrin-binding protein B C-lobe/N-lobe beta barrel domain-containing protein n=1 Tax=Loktanella salsilacus TaxID=195913 RepID=A0A1I4EUI8_9RHOB|nr:hypothetical protein [Loktanella salsilacus]SFL08186.1 hypothetical protein SAMN04488004_107130 [Loktanella salsilacus]
MIRLTLASSLLALLTACGDGQPLFDDADTDTDTTDTTDTTDEDGGITNDGAVTVLPGTTTASAETGIFRFEEAVDGGGLVEEVAYDSATDTFMVDGIGFDGANVYTRLPGTLGTVGTARVFGASSSVNDPLTGTPVDQVTPYRALYAVSKNQTDGEPNTSYAIVRTGGYVPYGYGGFVYQREGGVTLPTSGQANFSGDYSGIRVFDNRGGLEYTTGDMSMQIDFEDFNANDAVKGRLTNRIAIDQFGNEITLGTGDTDLQLPDVTISIQEGSPSIDSNGEITTEMGSYISNGDGGIEVYETGTFNGLVSGDTTTLPGGEIVGVIVLESTDPRYTDVDVQETGGVILYR